MIGFLSNVLGTCHRVTGERVATTDLDGEITSGDWEVVYVSTEETETSPKLVYVFSFGALLTLDHLSVERASSGSARDPEGHVDHESG
jgi:hypothetical protein